MYTLLFSHQMQTVKAELQSQLKRCEDEEKRRDLERRIRECDEETERYKQRLEEIAAEEQREEGDNSFIGLSLCCGCLMSCAIIITEISST